MRSRDPFQNWQERLAPIVCALLFGGVEAFLHLLIIPGFTATMDEYSGGEAQYPALTRWLMDTSATTEQFPWLILVATIVIYLLSLQVGRRLGIAWLACLIMLILLGHSLLVLTATYLPPYFHIVDVL